MTCNLAYYTVAHFSRSVPPGSRRIDSNSPDTLPNVAFHGPQESFASVVANTAETAQTFNVAFRGKASVATLQAGSLGTFVW
jgi:glucosylceramidase